MTRVHFSKVLVSSNFLEGLGSRVVRKVLVINKMSSAIVHSYYFTEVGPSVAAVVMLYIDSLPSLTAQARSSSNPWPLFRDDKRFSKLHKFLGKILCVPATSDAVERVFSHGGGGFSCVHIGHKVLSDLVFAKCNKHLK